jgi:dienelactone hydrolase
MVTVSSARASDVPLLYAAPPGARRLAIWQAGFTGSKETERGKVEELAARGWVALSYDPFQHGDRSVEPPRSRSERVFSNFRKHMWLILGRTTEDAPRVISWAIRELGVLPEVAMGGISMGGDVAVAAAGIDPRIVAVAATIATPDWMRPGSNTPPGEPDAESQALYEELDPVTHTERYSRAPAVLFENGAVDDHVPPDGARRFAAKLAPCYAGRAERLLVREHAGVGHAFTDAMWQNALAWFARFAPPA